MGRILKWFLITIASLIILLILFVVAVIWLVNPNDYRAEIERAVTAQTGRKLTIEGNLGLTFFPWIGLQANQVQLANAPSFGTAPFFQTDHLQLAVKVLPLLQGKLVVNTVSLEHPQIHLIRNEKGLGNWQVSGKPQQKPAAPKPGAQNRRAQPLPPILQNASLAGLQIRDGLVTWDDRRSGQHVVITPLNASAENIQLGAPITIKANWRGQIKNGTDIAGKLTGIVTADQQLQHINTPDLDLTLNATGGNIPGGKQQLRIRTQAAADLSQAVYRLTNLRLDAAGVQVIGGVVAQRTEGAMVATGQFEVPEFSPREALQRLGKAVPDTRDPNVLKRASAKTELHYRDGQFTLKPLTVHLDDSALTGQAKLRSFTGPAVDFDLALDRIDIDRYRSSAPPKGEQTTTAATPTTSASSAPQTKANQLPIKTLRTLDLNGHVHVGALRVSGAKLSNADVTIRAKDGQLRVHPLTAALYGGKYQGDMRLDVTGKSPRITLDEHLNGVQAEPLLTDTISFQKLLGTADLSLNANTHGQALEDWLQDLTGLAHFTFRNGAIKGIDIAQAIREALARIKGEPLPANAGPVQTDFTALGGTLNLNGGVVRNTDFSAKSPLLRVAGQGTANLLKQTVDYHLTVNIVGTLKGQGGQ
ncbi:MAG TPA: AsmA family protein, partial [Nitrococcus sp.]|nr:AsmA family protein [Nitrococcus sp.]